MIYGRNSQKNQSQDMTTKEKFIFIAFALAAALCCSCDGLRGKREGAGAEQADSLLQGNAIYYWKTTFELSPKEEEFLRRHDIKTIYMRFFDVDADERPDGYGLEPGPVATIQFKQAIPQGIRAVPVVFITPEAVKCTYYEEEMRLAANIIDRIEAILDYNDIPFAGEIQFDCDWTQSTQYSFYNICAYTKDILSQKGITFSGTVRLHQICFEELPFDKGVLMMYNVGNTKSYYEENSILNFHGAMDYMTGKRVKEMRKLRAKNCSRLDVAYPMYGWGVVFRNHEFYSLLHETDFSDTSLYKYTGPVKESDGGRYTVLQDTVCDRTSLKAGDEIRVEIPKIETIRALKKFNDYDLGELKKRTILYHLDTNCINRFSDEQIDEIYH